MKVKITWWDIKIAEEKKNQLKSRFYPYTECPVAQAVNRTLKRDDAIVSCEINVGENNYRIPDFIRDNIIAKFDNCEKVQPTEFTLMRIK